MRSSSPAVKRSKALRPTNTVSELEDIIKLKDKRIKQLENIIGNLESKHPSIHEIVRTRIEQERESFEEKTEKVLRILKKKDEEIDSLKSELQQTMEALEHQKELAKMEFDDSIKQEGLSKLYWTGRDRNSPEYVELTRENLELKKELEFVLSKNRTLLDELSIVRQQLELATSRQPSAIQLQELKGLREKTLDQTVEIETLRKETAELRRQASERDRNKEALIVANEEIKRLKDDIKSGNQRFEDLTREHHVLQENLKSATDSLDYQLKVNQDLKDHKEKGDVPTPVAKEMYDRSAAQYRQRAQHDASHHHVSLYQDKAQQYQEQIDTLQHKLQDAQAVEEHLREKIRALEERLQGSDQEGKLLFERVERLRSEQEAAKLQMQDQEVQLKSALDRVSANAKSEDIADAHVWWSYIWHELQKKESAGAEQHSSKLPTSLTAGGESKPAHHPGDFLYQPAHEAAAQVHEMKLKENMRQQAIEVANLRQELLGRKLTAKKEIDGLHDEIDRLKRENIRLQAAARIHKGDLAMKLAEKEATIRSLASRSDMHHQLAEARQQVVNEKLDVQRLRGDVESYRHMLEEEQIRLAQARKDIAAMQSVLDTMSVLQSISHIPGVEPSTLIGMMSGRVIALENDNSKLKQSLAEAKQVVHKLQQRHAAVTASAATIASGSSSDEHQGLVDEKKFAGDVTAMKRHKLRSATSPKHSIRSPMGAGPSRFDSPTRKATSPSLRRSGSVSSLLRSNIPPPIDIHDLLGSLPAATKQPISMLIEPETTPKQLLESFDVASLAQRVMNQELTIIELNSKIDKLLAEKMAVEKDLWNEYHELESADKILLTATLEKQEVLQLQIQQAKEESVDWREKATKYEKELRALHRDQAVMQDLEKKRERTLMNELLSDEFYDDSKAIPVADIHVVAHSSDAQSVQSRSADATVRKELEATKSLLRERTSQLKVLMDTLDSLQITSYQKLASDSQYHEDDLRLFNRKLSAAAGMGGEFKSSDLPNSLFDLAAMPGPTFTPMLNGNLPTTWGIHALVKRIVELTTELTSQCAAASMAERRAIEHETANSRLTKEVVSLKRAVKEQEERLEQYRIHLKSLNEQLKEADAQNIDQVKALELQNDETRNALRDAELNLRTAQITITELEDQLKLAGQMDFQHWLEVIALENQKIMSGAIDIPPLTATAAHSSEDAAEPSQETKQDKPADISAYESYSVRELVIGLLNQWREYVGTVPLRVSISGSPALGPEVNKTEQRFLQRVTDLVMAANERAEKCEAECLHAKTAMKRSDYASRISAERLKFCADHLNRYRKRCQAFESVVAKDRQYQATQQMQLGTLLRKTLQSERTRLQEVRDQLRVESKQRRMLETRHRMEELKIRHLQAQIAEKDAHGSERMNGKREAIDALESKLKICEEGFHKWFRAELPRLVSGLPITEDGLFMAQSQGVEGVDAVFGLLDQTAPITNQLLASMGVDRTYALSQALCSAKATQSVQDARINGLMEKISVLKDRNVHLEGVLLRWKDEIMDQLRTKSGAAAEWEYFVEGRKKKGDEEAKIDVPQQIELYAEEQKQLLAKIDELTLRSVALEEDNIECKGRLSHALARAQEMKALVEIVMSDEETLKTKAAQQITQIRLSIESEHATELKELRESYENEKRALMEELQRVAHAVEDAQLEVDPSAWKRMLPQDKFAPTTPPDAVDGFHDEPVNLTFRRDSAADMSGYGQQQQLFGAPLYGEPKEGSHASFSQSSSRRRSSKSHTQHRYDESKHRRRDSDGEDDAQDDDQPVHPPQNIVINTSKKSSRRKSETSSAGGGGVGEKKQSGDGSSDSSQDSSDVSLSEEGSAAADHHMKEIEVENLRRQVDIERRKAAEARLELKELQQLMSIQQSAFNTHLDKESAILQHSITDSYVDRHMPPPPAPSAATGIPAGSTNASAVEQQAGGLDEPSFRSRGSRASINAAAAAAPPVSSAEMFSSVYREAAREDRKLWPSITVVTDELLQLLQSVYIKHRHSESSLNSLLKTAMGMVARIKVMCDNMGPTAASVAATATARPAATHMDRKHVDDDLDRGSDAEDSLDMAAADRTKEEKQRRRSSSGFAAEHARSMNSLLTRLKSMESDLSPDIPERHQYLLRDLRLRVMEIEKRMAEEFAAEKNAWEAERRKLMRMAEENAELAEHMRMDQDENLSGIRRRYEDALRNAEDALEVNTSAAKQEITRLEEVVRQTNFNLKLALSQLERMQQERAQSATALGDDSMDDIFTAHQALAMAREEIEQGKQVLQQVQYRHTLEVNELKNHFVKFRRAQEEVVRSLEEQNEELRALNFQGQQSLPFQQQQQTPGAPQQPFAMPMPTGEDKLATLYEAQERIARLEYKYKTKELELDAVLKSLAKSSDSVTGNDDSGSLDMPTVNIPPLYPPGYRASIAEPHFIPPQQQQCQQQPQYMQQQQQQPFAPQHQSQQKFDMFPRLPTVQAVPPPPPPPPPMQQRRRSTVLPPPMQDSLDTAFGGIAYEVKEDIYEARIEAAEKEIESLHRSLLKERSQNTVLKKQLQEISEALNKQRAAAGMSAKLAEDFSMRSTAAAADVPETSFMEDYAGEIAIPESQEGGVYTKERVKQLVRRMNDMKRHARTEISKLKDYIVSIQGDATAKEELAKLRASMLEQKKQLAQLREDNMRKTKLLSTMKTAKSSEANALEQWTNEAKTLDENNKRLQRAIAAKEALIKDLKTKVEALEEMANTAVAERDAAVVASTTAAANLSKSAMSATGGTVQPSPTATAGSGLEMAGLTAPELRARLRVSELERARSRTRLQALKERVNELEAEVTTLREENTILQRMGERAEVQKASLVRKDQIIQSLKAQIDKMQADLDALREAEIVQQADSEKKIRQLQRQVDSAQRSQEELEKEAQLMRKRLTTTTEKIHMETVRSRNEQMMHAAQQQQQQGSKSVSFAAPSRAELRHAASMSSMATATSGGGSLTAMPVSSASSAVGDIGGATSSSHPAAIPSALGAAADDLKDVMSALGVSPMSFGSAVNKGGAGGAGAGSSSVSTSISRLSSGGGQPATPSGLDTSSSSDEKPASSVEKRLKQLMTTAMKSPVNPRKFS